MELQVVGGKLTSDFVVYHGHVNLQSWSETSMSGMRVTFRLPNRDDLSAFEEKDMIKHAVKRRLGDVYALSVFDAHNRKVATMGVWFKGMFWNEKRGATIVFAIIDRVDFDKFREYGTIDSGGGSSSLTITLVQLDEEENPINQRLRREQTEPARIKGGPKSRECGILCRDENFILWLGQEFPAAFSKGLDAAGLVREFCNIDSRAQLDHIPEAWKQWCELVNRYTEDSK